MHNYNNKNNSGMMWMMLICCLLPVAILAILFFAGGKLSSGGGYFWPILIGGMVLAHLAMMFKGHGGHGDNATEDKTDLPAATQPERKDAQTDTARTDAALEKQPEPKDKNKQGGGCCH